MRRRALPIFGRNSRSGCLKVRDILSLSQVRYCGFKYRSFLGHMNRLTSGLIATLIVTSYSVLAARQQSQEKTAQSNFPVIAIAPPSIMAKKLPDSADTPPDPDEIMLKVAPRVFSDACRLKWPLRFLPSDVIGNAYSGVAGHIKRAEDDIKLSELRQLAKRTGCRYIDTLRVNELVSRE